MTHTEDILEFNSADADVVLLSCDGARFAVHKCILSLASPFLKNMFSLPQAASPECYSNLSLECTETEDVLFSLLQFIYPVPNPRVTSLDELVPLLEAAQKFQLDYPMDELRTTLTDERLGFVKEAPLRVYAIATRFGLEEEMRVAAKGTLRYNVLDCPLNDDLKNINAYDYHRLLDLHRRHANAMQEVLKNPGLEKCATCTNYNQHQVAAWWTKFVELANVEISKRPATDVIFSHKFIVPAVEASKSVCGNCCAHAFRNYGALDAVKKRIDDIPFHI